MVVFGPKSNREKRDTPLPKDQKWDTSFTSNRLALRIFPFPSSLRSSYFPGGSQARKMLSFEDAEDIDGN